MLGSRIKATLEAYKGWIFLSTRLNQGKKGNLQVAAYSNTKLGHKRYGFEK